MEVVLTDNKNSYAAVQEENKRLKSANAALTSSQTEMKNSKSSLEKALAESKAQIEDAEKKITILGIKFESAVEESSSLEEENEKLNRKIDEIKNNIGNAETRSEQVHINIFRRCHRST